MGYSSAFRRRCDPRTVPLLEGIEANPYQLVRVRRVRQVVRDKDQDFRKMSRLVLMLERVLRYLLDDLTIALRSLDSRLDLL